MTAQRTSATPQRTSATPQAASPLVNVAGSSSSADRIDERKESADVTKSSLVEKSVTSRKPNLFDVNLANKEDDHDPEHVIMATKVLLKLAALTTCGKCGMATVELLKRGERQYCLAVKLALK
ncbi:hypothetical protein HPB47_013236 [Ixodes persulcatus]|nr:hypothetical protein HPB47_013236 [Ixodes persulcatus]